MDTTERETGCTIECVDIGGRLTSRNALQGVHLRPEKPVLGFEQYAEAITGALVAWLAFGAVLQPLYLSLLTLPFIAAVYLWQGALAVRAATAPVGLVRRRSAPRTGWCGFADSSCLV